MRVDVTRSDGSVVVQEWATHLLALFQSRSSGVDGADQCYGIVHYYESLGVDEELGVFVVKRIDRAQQGAYGIVPIESIQCHAHLVPDFDKKNQDGSYSEFCWDKVQDGRVDIQINRLRDELPALFTALTHVRETAAAVQVAIDVMTTAKHQYHAAVGVSSKRAARVHEDEVTAAARAVVDLLRRQSVRSTNATTFSRRARDAARAAYALIPPDLKQ